MKAATLINGERSEHLNVADRGLQYGDGLFETIAVHHGKPRRLSRHLARLAEGAERLAISLPPTETIEKEASELCAGSERAALKIIVTRGEGGRGYACGARAAPTRILRLLPWPDRPDDLADLGVAVRMCHMRLCHNPALAGIKHLNRLEQVLARMEWGDEYAEGLMCDRDGNVIEGTMSNLFAVTKGVLLTPDLSACGVAGVTRALVLEAAAKLGIATSIEPITPNLLAGCDETFLTNSLIGIWPVVRLDRSVEDKPAAIFKPGAVTRRLQEALQNE